MIEVALDANRATSVTATSAVLKATCTATKDGQSVSPTSVGFRWGTTSAYGREKTCSIDGEGIFTTPLTGLTPETEYHWTAFAMVEGKEYTLANDRTFTTDPDLVVEVTSNEATNKTSSGAYLTASYTSTYNGSRLDPTVVGFCWGTTSGTIKRGNDGVSSVEITASAAITGESFYRTLTGLDANKTYYWKAWVEVSGTTYYSDERQFTTEEAANTAPALGKSWLEMPAEMTGSEAVAKGHTTSNLLTHTYYYSSTQTATYRNYTICYNPDELTTYWVAYNLKSGHMGSGRSDDWAYVSEVAQSKQANVISSSYKSQASGGSNNYDRGHLLPSSSRNKDLNTINQQTFYVINVAPQNADFNQTTWNNLEQAVQSIAAKGEEIFVVTGTMCGQVSDGNGSFTPTKTYDNSGKEIPVPRYFYKVILRVKNSTSNPTSASAIGFWFTNKSHKDSYTNSTYVKSVNQIEEWTGLNFFVNLPDSIEESAESNTSWTTFSDF